MNNEFETMHTRLVAVEAEVINLRQGYKIINDQYNAVLGTLKPLTDNATEAARRVLGRS